MASKIFFSHQKVYFWISAFDFQLAKMHIVQWCTKLTNMKKMKYYVKTEKLNDSSLIFWFIFYTCFNAGALTNMWTTPFVKNLKNAEKYIIKNSMKYQKMKLLMQGHWPTCEPHHLSNIWKIMKNMYLKIVRNTKKWSS